MLSLHLPVLFGALLAYAVPHQRRQSGITSLSSGQVNSFNPFAHFASAAYCSPSVTANWQCGSNCRAESDFIPTTSGGDGSDVQFYYVGFSPSLNAVIVAHQGTNPEQIAALATDADAFQTNLDSNLFPGIDSSIEVHDGFANEQAKTANDVLSAVKQTMSKHGANSITVVGHSLGAAIALLDTVFLSLQLPGVPVNMVGFGLPRVGNQAFADYLDANLKVTHITNKKDPVPIVPGIDLGFHHPSGEVHINEAGTFNACAGQDNPSTQCSRGDVPNIFESNLNDHDGPYNGILMGSSGCS